jgi:hypothetical protein
MKHEVTGTANTFRIYPGLELQTYGTLATSSATRVLQIQSWSKARARFGPSVPVRQWCYSCWIPLFESPLIDDPFPSLKRTTNIIADQRKCLFFAWHFIKTNWTEIMKILIYYNILVFFPLTNFPQCCRMLIALRISLTLSILEKSGGQQHTYYSRTRGIHLPRICRFPRCLVRPLNTTVGKTPLHLMHVCCNTAWKAPHVLPRHSGGVWGPNIPSTSHKTPWRFPNDAWNLITVHTAVRFKLRCTSRSIVQHRMSVRTALQKYYVGSIVRLQLMKFIHAFTTKHETSEKPLVRTYIHTGLHTHTQTYKPLCLFNENSSKCHPRLNLMLLYIAIKLLIRFLQKDFL